jgi:predicted transcriptional regulator
LRKIPKYFDIRIDTSLPDTSTPAFFEFHNFTDLRWDKDAKVIEPENAESLTPILQKEMEKSKKSSRNSYSIDDSSRVDFTEL